MTPEEAIEFFDTRSALADVCEVSQTAVYHWVRRGWIPYDKQCLIEIEARKIRRTKKRRPTASKNDIPDVREAA